MNHLPPPIQHLGRYDILRVLGQGAMGVVYEGRDPNLDRRVAIKTVRVVGMGTAEIAEYEQRFKIEARSAGRLQHPNIVSVYDSDKHVDAMGQTAYIVMEFVQGEDLKHFLDQGKRFSLEQTTFMMSDLLSALDYAHRNKVIHRDIKPANMLLTKEGRIKLTDFGVARITDSGEATKTSGGTVGTLKYMSPEQVAGKGVDASSDLFSAGIVLYQLLTGVRPFDGEGYLDIVSKIVKEDPKPPSHIVGALPPSLDAVVAKALAKSKLDRFADAASFAAALKSAVNNADLTITPSAHARPEVLEGIGTFPGSIGMGTGSSGSTVTQELELVYWKDIKDSAEPEVLEGFLRRFPQGIYADLGKRKLKNLSDAQRAAGESSRYEATQLGGRSEATAAPSPLTTFSAAPPRDDPTVAPHAHNDSEYGASTQFASTQFPMTEPGALGTANINTSNQMVADAPTPLAVPLENAPAKPPPSARQSAMPAPWTLIAAAAVTIGAALFWFTRSPAPDPLAQVASNSVTPTTSITTPEVSATNASITPAGSSTAALSSSVSSVIATGTTPGSQTTTTATTSLPARAASALKAVLPARKASAPSAPAPVSASLPAAPAASPSPEPAPAREAAQRNAPASTASTPSAPTRAPAPAGPREACSDRLLLGFLSCMAEQCERSIYRSHPVCVERREMEERRRGASQSN